MADYSFKVNGMRNPVQAALMFMQSTGLPLDVESFKRTAKQVGDFPPETLADGFLVREFSDLERLCNLGGFSIYNVDGVLKCDVSGDIPVLWRSRP